MARNRLSSLAQRAPCLHSSITCYVLRVTCYVLRVTCYALPGISVLHVVAQEQAEGDGGGGEEEQEEAVVERPEGGEGKWDCACVCARALAGSAYM